MIRTCTLLIVSFLVVAGSSALAIDVRNVTFQTKTAGKVEFSHKVHMAQKDMAGNCKACHDAIFSIKKKTRYTMADMDKGRSCGACHNAKKAFGLKDCARCHQTREIVYKVKATGPTHFSHKSHIALSPDCTTCHPALFAAGKNKRASMSDMEKGKSCGACHNGKKAFGIDSCTTCHPVKDITFKVKETGPTLFSHTKHIAAYRCENCHTELYATKKQAKPVSMADMNKGKSCGACHDGKKAFPIKNCAGCHPVKDITFKVNQTGPTLFSHAKHLEAYQCGDCHTKLYPTTRSPKPVSMAEMEKGASCGACHNGKDATALKSCSTCHPTKELTFEVKDAGNSPFSHKLHGGMYACGDCHTSIYATERSKTRISMQEMESGKSCGACHEGKTAFSVKTKCEACHKM